MHVNIVVKPGWILERCARELEARVPGVEVNAGQRDRAVRRGVDLTYYLPAQDVRKYPAGGRLLGFVTHGDTALPLLPRFAGLVTMNQERAEAVRAQGATHVRTIRPGVDPPRRPITFGVIGRVYRTGRKGEHLVAQAVEAGFRVVACGPRDVSPRALSPAQWPCPQVANVADRAAFYPTIDYLLVTALDEGGPMTVPEALAHGVPVIAPRVGWCWEFPVIPYERGSWSSLRAVLTGLTSPPTWAAWAEGHRAFFEEVGRG